MADSENFNWTRNILIRVSPSSKSFTMEEQKPGGVISRKEISPIDLYCAINASLDCEAYLSSGLLPEHCIHVSMSDKEKRLVIWNPELHADICYEEKEYQNFPIPRLIFGVRLLESGRVAECSLGVVEDGPLSSETKMFYYPFSNVYENSGVCTGNNVLPTYKKLTLLKNFPRYLLGIPDNDDFYDPKHNKPGLSHGELLERLHGKDPAYYYPDILVPNGQTLEDFLVGR